MFSNWSKSVPILFLISLVMSGCDFFAEPKGKMPPTLALDAPAPNFEFFPINGDAENTKTLKDYRGKVIYLDFWASWCRPCLKSMPLLNEMRNKLDRNEFEIIAVNLDNVPQKGIDFLNTTPVDYPVVSVEGEEIYDLYKIHGLPTSYIIDKMGVLRFVHQGFREEKMAEYEKQVMELLED